MAVVVGDRVVVDEHAEVLLAIYEYMHNQEGVTPTPIPPAMRDLLPRLGVSSTSVMKKTLDEMVVYGYLLEADDEWYHVSRARTRMTYLGHHIAFTLSNEDEWDDGVGEVV